MKKLLIVVSVLALSACHHNSTPPQHQPIGWPTPPVTSPTSNPPPQPSSNPPSTSTGGNSPGGSTGTSNPPPPPPPPPPPSTPPTPSTGIVTLSWTAPTQNEDGTPLTNLAGYNIYYGTDPATLTNKINLNNPGLTMYVVDNLTWGVTFYFQITAYNSLGEESPRSAVVSAPADND